MKIPVCDTKVVREWISFQREFDTFWQTAFNGSGQGSKSTSGGTEGAEVIKIFPAGSSLLRITQTPSTDDFVSVIEIIGWERDDV